MSSSEEDEIIIILVKESECLYNRKHSDYYKSDVKQKVYDDIADFMQIKMNSQLSGLYIVIYKLKRIFNFSFLNIN